MPILFLLFIGINSIDPVHKLIQVFEGYSDEAIAEEQNILKELYERKFNYCNEYVSELTCRNNYKQLDPSSICNENGFEDIIKKISKNVPILDINLYGYSGKIDLTLLRGKIPVVNIKVHTYSKILPSDDDFSKLLEEKSDKMVKQYSNIQLVGNIKDKVSYLTISGVNTIAKLQIIEGPLDCQSFEFSNGEFVPESDQIISAKYFIATECVIPTIQWELVECDQFIFNFRSQMPPYIRIKFSENKAVIWAKAYYGNYYEYTFEGNVHQVPYSSIKEGVGIFNMDASHFDFQYDSSKEINIKIINLSIYHLIDGDVLHITSNNWYGETNKPKINLYAEKSLDYNHMDCYLDVIPSNFYEQEWTNSDLYYFKDEDNDGDNKNGLPKSTIIIIVVVAVVVVVVVAIIVIVVIIKKKRAAADLSNSAGEDE